MAEGRGPSIYAAFTLARLVHSFKDRLRSGINARQFSNKRSLPVPSRSFGFSVYPGPGRYSINSPSEKSLLIVAVDDLGTKSMLTQRNIGVSNAEEVSRRNVAPSSKHTYLSP